jgi:four helix bundle protein
MNKDDLIKRTKEFAHRCVKSAVSLPKTYLGNHIKDQLIRCSTSVAANYRTACHAISKRAFISKLNIVIEEADVRRPADGWNLLLMNSSKQSIYNS